MKKKAKLLEETKELFYKKGKELGTRQVMLDYVWNVQTPQVFKVKLYMVSAYTAKSKGFVATDDCMLAENAGFKVKLVDTGKENIKITVKDDIVLAEHILTARGEE